MSFTDQKQNWQGLAETDPMWAVLSDPEKRGGGWDQEEFYGSGLAEADDVLWQLERLGLPVAALVVPVTGRGLDVGCGPGRVTHGFAPQLDEVVGYDIAPGMLELARKDAAPNESFIQNTTDDLSPFGDQSFDFVYCNKVLQHVDPDRVGNYIAEMARVLKPGGVLFLQMLSHPTGWEGTRESSPDPSWRLNGIVPHYTVCFVSIQDMVSALLEVGLTIHQIRLVDKGEGQSIFSYEYICQRSE